MTRPAHAPTAQLDKARALALHRAGQWVQTCPYLNGGQACCLIVGGTEGLAAHIATVHPEQVTP